MLYRNKYRNKYRIESARHPTRDYSAGGFYFVTICTLNKKHFFGRIDAGPPAHLIPTVAGEITDAFWYRIPEKYPFAHLDEWVVMPNHMHGILQLSPPEMDKRSFYPSEGGVTGSNNHMIHRQSLATIIGWYKGRVKYETGKSDPDANFAWQPKFNDRIIRSPEELDRIRQYIRDNPKTWAKDKLYSHQP